MAPEPSNQVLQVQDLRIETESGADIVSEVSFSVGGGEILALVGESGCGKTSTALALLGHARSGTRITRGSVLLDDRDLLRLSPVDLRRTRGRIISYIPQDPTMSLSPRLRIGGQIIEAMTVHGIDLAKAGARVDELLEQVRLPADRAFRRRYPFELSGGQQQRVAIAMALACKPRVVVLDEPTTGLDVTTQKRILDLLLELRVETKAAFVYVTHDLAVVDNLADGVAVMYAGRIVEAGPRSETFGGPGHPYSSLLLSSVPRLGISQHLAGIPGTAPPPGARPSACFFAPRCPIAIDRCVVEYPPAFNIGPGHAASCWRALDLSVQTNVESGRVSGARISDDLLALENVVASYERGGGRAAVLHGISFSVHSGECVALVGETGSGKSTIGRCIVGLHRPDNGSIRLRGEPLASHASERRAVQQRAVQIVFQNPDRSLNPSHSVATSIARPLQLYGLADSRTVRRRVAELCERVQLSASILERYPRELSGGQKQRVAIARALAAGPEVLVCDEITSALDVSIQATVINLLEDIKQDGLSLLFITHNLPLVSSIADRVVVLKSGVIKEEGETSRIIQMPTDEYTRALLAATPKIGVAS